MKKYFNILFILFTFSFCQDRSVIFNTGSPDDLTAGHDISSFQSIANKVYVSNDYVLEAMVFYMTLQSLEGNVIVSIREDHNGLPGDLISDLAYWNHTVDGATLTGYNLIVTTDQCIYLDAGNSYWWTRFLK